MDYVTLDSADRLRIARGELEAAETDHYRIAIRPQPNSEVREAELETQIESLRDTVSDLETEQEANGDS